MIIFPAMDLRNGRVVRLRQGRAEAETVYSDRPAEVARRWLAEGATWLHVVDLDRALGSEGAPNHAALQAILDAVDIPIQFGGGLRDRESVQRALALGVRRVVVGTLAVEQPEQFAEIVAQVGAERIVVAADVKEGRVATRGWQAVSDLTLVAFGRRMCNLGVQHALVTDIARDGMLTGIDAHALARTAHETGLQIIASGGAATRDDLHGLMQYADAGIEGAIIGQALYTGAIRLADALAIVNRAAGAGLTERAKE
ncbi:MAG: 1-(5-phosphoribosyl)-5-[(5-phosphoribosylamino)methylideneamino]imidazole-4-carboxamide isomerase [Anaerolineae bacterium]